LQCCLEIGLCPQAHHVRNAHQLAPSVAFFHLSVDQAWLHQPSAQVVPSTTHLEPLAKVGCKRIKVEIESITGKERETVGGQSLSQRVDEQVCHVLCARTELEHG
jgi:hypothetical protein